ncbi:MAG: hypothetical protein FJ399_10525, partial [Verrucomicrobia bacterium]|nr:hypothetical protein [Verrucomicrobiota bacterium]
MAALVGCGLSGLALHGVYDPQNASRTIAEWLLGHPGLVLIRNFHYWSAQLLVLSLSVLLWRRLQPSAAFPPGRLVRVALVLCLPTLVFLIASGHLLRGDADARSFQPLFTALVADLPYFGLFLASLWPGIEANLPALLFHHTISASAFVALVLAASLRRPFPRLSRLAFVACATLVWSLVVSPGLNDGLNRQTNLPWLFLGAQEFLHWQPETMVIVLVGLAALWLAWALPRFSPTSSHRIRLGLLVTAGLYAILTGLGLFWPQTDSGSRHLRWPAGRGDWRLGSIVSPAPASPGASHHPVPVVLGRPEGCLVCHSKITGLGDSHRPEAIGCASCHGGNTTTLDADRAHAEMIRIPGNLSDAPHTCGTAGCHSEILPRVERSIMATFSGVIDVNRRIFGEPVDAAAPPPHVRELKHSAADSHLRQLCVSCHLGQPKEAWGPIGQESRGGGCNACHLTYSPAALEALDRFESAPLLTRKTIPAVHPSF